MRTRDVGASANCTRGVCFCNRLHTSCKYNFYVRSSKKYWLHQVGNNIRNTKSAIRANKARLRMPPICDAALTIASLCRTSPLAAAATFVDASTRGIVQQQSSTHIDSALCCQQVAFSLLKSCLGRRLLAYARAIVKTNHKTLILKPPLRQIAYRLQAKAR